MKSDITENIAYTTKVFLMSQVCPEGGVEATTISCSNLFDKSELNPSSSNKTNQSVTAAKLKRKQAILHCKKRVQCKYILKNYEEERRRRISYKIPFE